MAEVLIPSPQFCFYMQTVDQGVSHVDIGPPQTDSVKGGSLDNVVNLPINKDFFWSTWLQGVAFSTTEDSNAFAFEEGFPYTITDTGSSHLFVPETYYEALIDKMVEAAGSPEYQITDGIVLTTCDAQWTSLFFMVNEYWVEIKPAEYLFDVSESGDRSICHIAMLGNNYNFFLMGLPFFQGYYTIHDMTVPQIGYIPTDKSLKTPLKLGTVPTQFLEPIVRNWWLETGPLIFALLVLLFYS